MDKKILYDILKSESEILSSDEIESIMNEELDKSPLDMDTDLIDRCLEALNTADEEKQNKRKKKYRIGKVILAAAIFAAVIGVSIPVCAKHFSINVPEGIVTVYKDCFKIDLNPDEYVFDVNEQLESDSLDSIVLPKMLFESSAKIKNYKLSKYDTYNVYKFDFSNEDVKGCVTITEDCNGNEFGDKKLSSNFENFEAFDVNGITVLVCGMDNNNYINYFVDGTEYEIAIECDYETACRIAKGI